MGDGLALRWPRPQQDCLLALGGGEPPAAAVRRFTSGAGGGVGGGGGRRAGARALLLRARLAARTSSPRACAVKPSCIPRVLGLSRCIVQETVKLTSVSSRVGPAGVTWSLTSAKHSAPPERCPKANCLEFPPPHCLAWSPFSPGWRLLSLRTRMSLPGGRTHTLETSGALQAACGRAPRAEVCARVSAGGREALAAGICPSSLRCRRLYARVNARTSAVHTGSCVLQPEDALWLHRALYGGPRPVR